MVALRESDHAGMGKKLAAGSMAPGAWGIISHCDCGPVISKFAIV